jgi:hypothetical protein
MSHLLFVFFELNFSQLTFAYMIYLNNLILIFEFHSHWIHPSNTSIINIIGAISTT